MTHLEAALMKRAVALLRTADEYERKFKQTDDYRDLYLFNYHSDLADGYINTLMRFKYEKAGKSARIKRARSYDEALRR